MTIERIECASVVKQSEWDGLAQELGGSFFHCHAHGIHESSGPNVEPLFVRGFDANEDCVGIAVGTVLTPRYWPFSGFCKKAVLGALPAVKGKKQQVEKEMLAAIEKALQRKGIFHIHISSYESLNSSIVLSRPSYELSDRCEFYLDLSRPLEKIWEGLKGSRRTDIRKARKRGLEVRMVNTTEGLELLFGFQSESMRRRGIELEAFDKKALAAKARLVDSGKATVLITYRNGDPLNGGMFGIFNGKAYYLHSGSSADGNRSAGPAFLLWSMIEMSKERGLTSLNLGGTAANPAKQSPEYGLHSFKRDFGTTIVLQPAGSKTLAKLGARLDASLSVVKKAVHS